MNVSPGDRPSRRRRERRLRAPIGALFVALPCAIGVVVLLVVHPASAREQTFTNEPSTSIQSVFLSDCAVCHGAKGTGTAQGPSLEGVGAAAIDYWVSTGRMPLAPNHRSSGRISRKTPKYSPTEIKELVAYVAKLTGGGLPIPEVSTAHANLAAGGVLYRLNCAACHAWAGTGGALQEREAPSLFASTPTQIAEAVRTGPEPMPAFGEAALDQQQLDDVVAYVRGLDHADNRGGNPLGHAGPLAEGAVAIILGLGALLIAARLIGTRT
ncbi:MAG TPA: c-type cytochrome [Acidimicrobiia bacterium]|jgi:ubiquinol-cytochrome c reductase cytochrome c subunit|nr:c-type cytochrome [Acidimicrobiia bacterium]